MKSVLLLSFMASFALAVPLGHTSSSYYYTPYVNSHSYQSYPGAFWQGLGYQQQYSFGNYQQQYPYSQQWGQQYFSSAVQALQVLEQIEQRLFYFQHQLEENQEVYPQYQWQQYVQAINSYLSQVHQLEGYFQSYVQGSQPIPTFYQSQASQLFQQIYNLFQEIQSVAYGQGQQYSSSFPVYQWGGYGLQSRYPYNYQPFQAVQTVV